MHKYFFWGRILPERAQLNMNFNITFQAISNTIEGDGYVSIFLNQVMVKITLNEKCDIQTLERITSSILENEMAKMAFIRGFNYSVFIDRGISENLDDDWTFGIDYPLSGCLHENHEVEGMLLWLRKLTIGADGLLISRCLNDFKSALTYLDDAAFYCYRAIETLRNHCGDINKIDTENKLEQWQTFREATLTSREDIEYFTRWSKQLRHGRVAPMTRDEELTVINKAHSIIFSYLNYMRKKIGQ